MRCSALLASWTCSPSMSLGTGPWRWLAAAHQHSVPPPCCDRSPHSICLCHGSPTPGFPACHFCELHEEREVLGLYLGPSVTRPTEGGWQLNTDLNQSEISLEHLGLAGARELFASEHCVTNKTSQEIQVTHRTESEGFSIQRPFQNSLPQIPQFISAV